MTSPLRDQIISAIRAVPDPAWPSDGAEDAADALLPLVSSWDFLMAVLAERYPPDVFNGSGGDPGPQIVALTRALGSFGPSTLCECGHPVVDHDRSPTFCKAALRDLSGPCPCMTFAAARPGAQAALESRERGNG